MTHYTNRSRYSIQREQATVRALTSCTHPDASNGAHAYRDGVCRCGALKRNADGSVPTSITRDAEGRLISRRPVTTAVPWCEYDGAGGTYGVPCTHPEHADRY